MIDSVIKIAKILVILSCVVICYQFFTKKWNDRQFKKRCDLIEAELKLKGVTSWTRGFVIKGTITIDTLKPDLIIIKVK